MTPPEPSQVAELPRWRRWLAEPALIYLGWVLPGDRPFQVTYFPSEETWSVQVLQEDAARRAAEC